MEILIWRRDSIEVRQIGHRFDCMRSTYNMKVRVGVRVTVRVRVRVGVRVMVTGALVGLRG